MSVLPISNGKPYIESDDIKEVIKSLKSGFLSQGNSIDQFERLFEKKLKQNGVKAVYTPKNYQLKDIMSDIVGIVEGNINQ